MLGSQFRSSHIPDPHDGSVRICADGDGGKLLRRFEHALDDNGGVQTLSLHRRRPAELARGNLRVVDPQRRDDILNRHPVIGEFIGVEPDPHGVLGAKGFNLADPRNP